MNYEIKLKIAKGLINIFMSFKGMNENYYIMELE